MKRTFTRIAASILVVLMMFTSIPLQGFTGIEADLSKWLTSEADAAYIGPYNATAAVEYARKYALSYNKEWYFYVNGGDCANFVSQSLFVAGVPMTSAWHSYDCNSTAYVMNDSYTWIRAQELMDYLVSIGGKKIVNPSPSDFSLGDAVFYNWNGGRFDHSAIVTAIDGGVPKVSCHSTPEMASKLDAHWTLGKDKSCAVLIKLNGDVCTANNAPDYDIYKLNTGTGIYSSPGSGFITTVSYRHTVRVTEIKQSGGKSWGYFNYKGTWGWIDLSKATYKGHFDRIQVDHIFGDWYTVREATCVDKGLEERVCSRCGYTEQREISVGGHKSGSAANCINASVCTACGTTLAPALGHSFTQWILEKSPTCVQKAVYKRNCTRCGLIERKDGDFGNHNYMANVTTPGCTTSGGSTMKCTYCGDSYIEDSSNVWSGWTTDINSALVSDPSLYETKTQYRYIDRQFHEVKGTADSNYTIPGWSVYSKDSYWGEYGKWSEYQDSYVASSDYRQVETREVVTVPESVTYTYHGYVSYNCPMSSSGYWTHFCLTCGKGKGGDWKEQTYTQDHPATEETLNQRCGHSASVGGGTYDISYRCDDGGRYYRVTENRTPAQTKTQYRYRDRQVYYNYVFSSWPAWTDNWSDSVYTASDNRQIQTRTLYRYKLAALGHNFGAPKTVSPTCTEKGYTVKTCSRCGFDYKYDFTNALGHNWGGWYTVVEAKPGQAGLERRDCLRCGIYETRGHNLTMTVVEPTCTEQGYTIYKCKDSGCTVEYKSDYVNKLGHNMRTDLPEVITYPTCTEDGLQKIPCTRCKYYETKVMPALGHDYDRDNDGDVDTNDAVETVDATCLKDGYRYYECEHASDHNYKETITATDHNMSNWIEVIPSTCGEEGYFYRYCKNDYCDITVEIRNKEFNYYEEKDNYFIQHNYSEPIENFATCLTDGYTIQTCEICGDVIITPGEKALGHDFSEYVTITEATCIEEGLSRKTCKRCGIYDEIVTPPLGHDDVSEEFTANCISEAGIKNTCQRCDRVEIIYDGDIDPDAHNMGEWYLEKKATCTEPGAMRRDCLRDCGYFEREPIVVSGHNYEQTENIAPDCENDGKIVFECKNDGCDSAINEVLMRLGHEFLITTIEPTCTEKGYDLYECTRNGCGHTETHDEVAELGHKMGEWNVVKLPTETEEGLEERDCIRNDLHEERVLPVLKKYTATFVADGKEVTKLEFLEGATELTGIPDVPTKDRYEGKWEDYTLKNEDIIINAVYTLIPPEGLSGIETEKTAKENEITRDVIITLKASSDAKTIISETTEKTPLDIILVVDQSGSMKGEKHETLKDSVKEISAIVLEEAKLNNVDHRLAIVGFAMGSYTQDSKSFPPYMNSAVLTVDGGPVQYSVTPSVTLNNAYKNALVSVNDNGKLNSIIVNATEAIDADGATAVNVGLTMAANIFAQNSIEGTNRKRVVILMTDGEPTSYSSYDEKGVANPAILQANQIKSADNINGCGATIYSIGIDCNTKTNKKFLNAVSSNYDYVESMSSDIATDTNDYFLYSDRIDELNDMFVKVVTTNMITTTDFKDITLVDTISKNFTMTSQQEISFRESVIEKYGIKNSDITVTRNADGTTSVKIEHINPLPETNAEGKVIYAAEVSFTVSANENALLKGTYETNTEDAGVILAGSEVYEKLFSNQSVTFTEDAGAAIFSINGEIYQITSVEIGGTVLPPDYRVETGYTFSDWDVPANFTLNGGVAEFNAELERTPYYITWNIGEETTTDTYYANELIFAPEAPENLDGLTFIGWNTDIPVAMPEKNLEFTACYAVHTHNYTAEVTIAATCEKNGLMTYTCSCERSYTEVIPSFGGEHEWVAITSEAALDDLSLEEFRCNKCNDYMSKAIVYKVVSSTSNYRGGAGKSITIYDFSMYNPEAVISQPGEEVKISMPVPDGMENATNITVYRIDDNGNEIKLESSYSRKNKNITFYTDHFCNFKFIAEYACAIKGSTHPDEDNNFICDDCFYSGRCPMCETYESMKDSPIGILITIVHFIIHMISNIKSVT